MYSSFVFRIVSRIQSSIFFFSVHRPVWHHTITDIKQYVPPSQHPSFPIFVKEINNAGILNEKIFIYSNIYTIALNTLNT